MSRPDMEPALDPADDLIGRFWPCAPPRTEAQFDDVGTPYVIVVRHVPSDEDCERALRRFGPPAGPHMTAWRSAWESAVGPMEPFVRSALARLDTPEPDARARSREALVELSPDLAANGLFARERSAVDAVHRDEAFHILEDAFQTLSLLRAGCAFDLVLNPMAVAPTVLSSVGGQGASLVLLDWRGADGEQDRHSAACRRARALCEAQNPYWESPAFRSLAGRGMAVARTAPHLAAILRDMALAGHARAFLKSTATKAGTWVVDLSRAVTLEGAALAAHGAMGASYASLDGTNGRGRPGILVQEFHPFTHEHRFLVVGHRIVASTASDRDLSVLDVHYGRILHPGVAKLKRPARTEGAYDRGEADTVPDRDLVASMARKARLVVRSLGREGMVPDCYCLDIGLGERGVLPIEVNTAVRCGLYAADWTRFAGALARTAPMRALRRGPVRFETRRDKVEDAFSFMLDTLCDEPPRLLTELGRRLVEMGERPEAAVEMGRACRAEHAREADEPFGEGLQTLEAAHSIRVQIAELEGKPGIPAGDD